MGRLDRRSKRKERGRGGLDWHDDELEGFERMGAWVSTLGGQAFNNLLTGKKYRAIARRRKLEAEAAAAAAAAQSQRQSVWQTAGACLGPAVNTVQQIANGASSGRGVYETIPQQDQHQQQQHGQSGGGGGKKGSMQQQQPGVGGRSWRDVWIEAQVWRHELARKCPMQTTAAALIAALVVVLASVIILRRCRRAKRGARGSTKTVFIGSGEQSTAAEHLLYGASGAEGRSKPESPRLPTPRTTTATPDDAAEDTPTGTATTDDVTDGDGVNDGGGGDGCRQGPPIVDPNINYWPADRMSKYTNLLMSLSFLFPGGRQRNMKMVRFSMWQTEDDGNGAIKKAPFEAYEVMGYEGSEDDGDDDEDKEEEGEGEGEGGVDAERKDEKDDRHAESSSTPGVSSAASGTSSDGVAVSHHSNGGDKHVKMESQKINNGNNSSGEEIGSSKDSDDHNDWRQHVKRDTSIA